jgi:hypothetical protein
MTRFLAQQNLLLLYHKKLAPGFTYYISVWFLPRRQLHLPAHLGFDRTTRKSIYYIIWLVVLCIINLVQKARYKIQPLLKILCVSEFLHFYFWIVCWPMRITLMAICFFSTSIVFARDSGCHQAAYIVFQGLC